MRQEKLCNFLRRKSVQNGLFKVTPQSRKIEENLADTA